MKKIVLILMVSLFTSFILAGVSFAEETQVKSLDTILSEIRTEQSISDSEEIDPAKVSQAKLEELGDSVMAAMIGNSAMHEQMDNRLGGEGSESLKLVHINIGLNYLSDYPNGMMNLMSGGMFSNSTTDSGWNWDNMMGNNNSTIGSGLNRSGVISAFAFAGIAAGFVLLLLIIIAVVVFAILKSKKTPSGYEKSFEILARRYANGEITKEEFDTMTKNIRSLK